ncbi:MAG: transcription-repair coupling factor [Phycisphaerae bacterium]
MDIFAPIRQDPRLAELASLLTERNRPVGVDGLWGSCAPVLVGLLAERLQRPFLLVTAHSDEADDCRDDLETAVGFAPDLLPQLETLTRDAREDDEAEGERLRLCMELLAGTRAGAAPRIIVAPIHALMQPVASANAIAAASLPIEVGMPLDPDELCRWLDAHGFTRCEQVDGPGDFARRGGIVDIVSHANTDPVRIEFFGDEVESIRLFDAATQRSAQGIQSTRVPARTVSAGVRGAAHSADPPHAARRASGRAAAAGAAGDDATTTFLNLLPPETIVAFHEPLEIQEMGRTYWQRLTNPVGLFPVDAVFRRCNAFTQLHLQRFATDLPRSVRLEAASLPPFPPKAAEALQVLAELARECEVVALCDSAAEAQRLEELLAEQGERPERLRVEVALLRRGFRWRTTAYVPNHELFQRYGQRRTLRRVAPARPIDSFFDLNPNDLVVHIVHGIGRFLGLKTLESGERREEYLAIEFADHAVVHVATSQIHLVQKYVGNFRGRATLSKLGGQSWKRTKERVAEAVSDLAADLLSVQAARTTQQGLAFPQDTTWQREFEGTFPYPETPDQLRALGEIKSDLTRTQPMDRLLCGDVGYGKTELAIRASFKVIEYGKQVAVLVPTTVLAEQHYRTFAERLRDFPFAVEVLSRFRAKREQTRIVERARKGQVDILIGTHRLLSADVRFADLGLLVIDEEQRFGVEAKERLKRLRATVDVLTLSATPIPRTLHMSLLGIRDISSLATPPVDRRAIVTQVRTWDDALIREAVVRELSRDGQVYFVHNFIRDIHNVANHLRALVPDARVVVGHGQMPGPELEEVMLKFVRHEADILVSTNIIESGLDIPAANTIFVNRADRFGLADLHQLRGRVGRSKHRAYCYVLLSPKHTLTDVAAKRLKAIEQYSNLGAGFQIAMRDLEIRGAGNILGPEQSGHIEAVGYEMYCQLLDQAVRRLRNEDAEPYRPVNLDLGFSASIPRAYIRAERQRMEVYKRLTVCTRPDEIRTLESDLRDAFGPLPDEVRTLLAMAEVRVLARPWGIRAIVLKEPDVIFSFAELQRVQPLFCEGPGSPRLPDPQTLHWRLPKRMLEMPALLDVLRKQLARQPAPAAAVV